MADVEELYCLLIPVAEARLLLPNTAIVEVIGYTSVQRTETGPSWMVGDVMWEGHRIPLLSFEAAAGGEAPEPSPRTRVAILYNIGEQLDDDFIAITTQGHPHLIRVDRDVLESASEEVKQGSVELCRVRIGTQQAIIPDLEKLEELVGRARPASAQVPLADEETAAPGRDTDGSATGDPEGAAVQTASDASGSGGAGDATAVGGDAEIESMDLPEVEEAAPADSSALDREIGSIEPSDTDPEARSDASETGEFPESVELPDAEQDSSAGDEDENEDRSP